MTIHYPLDRRTFLVAGGLSFFGLDLAHVASYGNGQAARKRKVAQSAILIWLSGGASHIDTWDMKPNAPQEYRGSFKPVATSVLGISLCEHLPRLAKQAHHLAIIRSLGEHGRIPAIIMPVTTTTSPATPRTEPFINF